MFHRLNRITLHVMCAFLLVTGAGAMETNIKKDAPPSNEIEMPFIVCPATKAGKLIGYYYISYRMVTPSAEEALDIKSKLAVLQDAYVRAVYSKKIYKSDHPEEFDKAAFETIILNATKGLVKADQVTGLKIRAIKYSPLHPRAGAPKMVNEVVKPDTVPENTDSAHKKAGGH